MSYKTTEKAREAARNYYYNNKEIAKANHKRWREENKEYVLEKQKQDKRKRKLWAIEYLGGVCQGCQGTFHPAVYEFHHRQPEEKDRDPSKMLSLSLERLKAELDKCSLLCANCHRLTHHQENFDAT